MGCWVDAGNKKGKKGSVNGKQAEESDIFKLVRMIMQRNFDPVLPFATRSKLQAYLMYRTGLHIAWPCFCTAPV